jgi:NAD+--dinitrogen-reductase ADP-D-ribosyltransferase
VDEEPRGLWQRGNATNLIGMSAERFASSDFNESALPVHIAGVRETNPDLFRLLATATDEAEAGELFTAYMATMFGLGDRVAEVPAGTGRRRYRASYLRLLRGWAYDANGPEGAVLKGWVESRFGLFPTFHKRPLARFSSAEWTTYVEEKMGSRFHNNAIFSQLDLLFEFAQWLLARFNPDMRHRVLYRGVNDFSEHPIIARLDRRHVILRLNNLVSFTNDKDVASWFGDRILEARVPAGKIVFFDTLLPKHPLRGEGEVLAIGGDYLVKATYH